MVAQSDDVRTGREQFVVNGACDSEAGVGRVFAIGYREINLPATDAIRKMSPNGLPPCLSHDVSDEQDTHLGYRYSKGMSIYVTCRPTEQLVCMVFIDQAAGQGNEVQGLLCFDKSRCSACQCCNALATTQGPHPLIGRRGRERRRFRAAMIVGSARRGLRFRQSAAPLDPDTRG
jgi:hypothetical protein